MGECQSLYHLHACACGDQKVLEPLKLELEMIVSHDVVTGNRTRILWKSS